MSEQTIGAAHREGGRQHRRAVNHSMILLSRAENPALLRAAAGIRPVAIIVALSTGMMTAFAGCQPAATPFSIDAFPEARALGAIDRDDDLSPPDALRFHHDLNHHGADNASSANDPMSNGGHGQPSDEPMPLSLESAVVTALQNNRGLRVEQLQPMIAGTFEQIERARFDLRVEADAAVTRERRQQVSPATREIFDTLSEQQRGGVGLAQEFATGTDIAISLDHARSDSDRTPVQHTTRAGVTLTQALLQGANWDANVASIRQARLETLASVYELRAFAETLVADVETTFWDCLLAQREIEIFESSLDLARQQLEEAERRVEVGVVAETELAAARAEIAQRREELINARANERSTRLRLLRLVNPDAPAGWQQQIELESDPASLDPDANALHERDTEDAEDVEQHVRLARLMRPELNEARLRLASGRLEVVKTRNGLLPRLDFFLTLGKSGFAETFGRSLEDLDGRGYDIEAGLRFSYPIGNRLAEADHHRARLSRRQATEGLHNLVQLVDLDVRLAHIEVERAREQIEAIRATRELREETLRAEQEKFRVGMSTAILVAQAQRNLLESQIAEVRAQVNYRQTLIELYRLEGTLLKRRAIRAPGEETVADGTMVSG